MIKAIPTKYRGVKFKSKLEASWAKWLDTKSIIWSYESEGASVNNEWYLPDFWLPEIRTILEVKGMIQGIKKAKRFYNALQRENIEYELNHLSEKEKNSSYRTNHQWAKNYAWGTPHKLFILGGSPVPSFYTVDSNMEGGYNLVQCRQCGKTSLTLEYGSWGCRACGNHEGKHDIRERLRKILRPPTGWT